MLANTRIAIMRAAESGGGTVDHDDDPWTPAIPVGGGSGEPQTITPPEGIAASIIERTRVVFDPTTSTPRTVRELVGRVAPLAFPGVDGGPEVQLAILAGDEVRDLRTGTRYVVEGAVTESRTIAGGRAIRFALSETDGE